MHVRVSRTGTNEDIVGIALFSETGEEKAFLKKIYSDLISQFTNRYGVQLQTYEETKKQSYTKLNRNSEIKDRIKDG